MDELTTLATIYTRKGTEGTEYVIVLADGSTASVFDGEEGYWGIANAIDDKFPVN